jgi:antirestriction protein
MTKKGKILLILSLLFLSFCNIFACDANCISCHPNLLNESGKMDKNHEILNRCTRCHIAKKDEKDHGACGADCWQCHDIKEVSKINIDEHKVLNKCIECHKSIDKDFFDISTNREFNNNLLIKSLEK